MMIFGDMMHVLGLAIVVTAAHFGAIYPPLPGTAGLADIRNDRNRATSVLIRGDNGTLYTFKDDDISGGNFTVFTYDDCTACAALEDGGYVFAEEFENGRLGKIVGAWNSFQSVSFICGGTNTSKASLKKALNDKLELGLDTKYSVHTIPLLKYQSNEEGEVKETAEERRSLTSQTKKSDSLNNANDEGLKHFGTITPNPIQQVKVTEDSTTNGVIARLEVVSQHGRLSIGKDMGNGKANLSCWDSCIAYIVLDNGSHVYPDDSGIILDIDVNRAKNVHFMFGNASIDMKSLRDTLISHFQSRLDIKNTIYTVPLQKSRGNKGQLDARELKGKEPIRNDAKAKMTRRVTSLSKKVNVSNAFNNSSRKGSTDGQRPRQWADNRASRVRGRTWPSRNNNNKRRQSERCSKIGDQTNG